MPITNYADLSVYKRPISTSRGGDKLDKLGNIANFVQNITGKVKANRAADVVAAREKDIDEIYKRKFQGYNPQKQRQFKASGQQGPPRPDYDQRMEQVEGEMFQKYPRRAQAMRKDWRTQESTRKKSEMEIAEKIITNKKALINYNTSQYELIDNMLTNVDNEKSYQWVKKEVKEIMPSMQMPNTYIEANRSFIPSFPGLLKTRTKLNNLILKGESEKLGMKKIKQDMSFTGKEKGDASVKERRAFKKSFIQDSRVKNYNEVHSSMIRMEAAWDDRPKDNKKRGGIDQALIISFNKMLDPGSVVRESEFARTAEGVALINKIRGGLTKLTEGGVSITDADRQEFVDTARRLYGAAKTKYTDILETYKEDSDESNYDEAKIITSHEIELLGLGEEEVTPEVKGDVDEDELRQMFRE